jgi:biopolymer transport protein ExbD
MAQQAQTDTSDLEINMTPMIDVVFQLIIFLMLANDMSRKELEDLKLPLAFHAQQDEAKEKDPRVVVNVIKGSETEKPKLKVRGQELTLPEFKRLLLERTAEAGRENDSTQASKLFVLIRADEKCRWQDVQFVMQACADITVKVYKLQFATDDPKKVAEMEKIKARMEREGKK